MHYRYYDRYVVAYENRESGGAEGNLVGDEVDTIILPRFMTPVGNNPYILLIKLYYLMVGLQRSRIGILS